jgi:hypothetical protein
MEAWDYIYRWLHAFLMSELRGGQWRASCHVATVLKDLRASDPISTSVYGNILQEVLKADDTECSSC